MTIRVAINGYGRIGRNILRAHYESGKQHDIEIVAINDLGDANTNAHLTQYDTAHGRFPGTVKVDGDSIVVNGDRIKVLANRNPAELPWGALGVDVVLDVVGGNYLMRNVASIRVGGTIVQVGVMGGGSTEINLGLLLPMRAHLVGTVLRARPLEEKVAASVRFAAEVIPAIESGTVRPVIDRRFPLANIADAHRYLETNANVGKVLIDL